MQPERVSLAVEVHVSEAPPFVAVITSQKTVLSTAVEVEVQSSSPSSFSGSRSSHLSIGSSQILESPKRPVIDGGGSQPTQSLSLSLFLSFFGQQFKRSRRHNILVMGLQGLILMGISFKNQPVIPSQPSQPQSKSPPMILIQSIVGGLGNLISPNSMLIVGGGPGGSGRSCQRGKIGIRWSSSSSSLSLSLSWFNTLQVVELFQQSDQPSWHPAPQ